MKSGFDFHFPRRTAQGPDADKRHKLTQRVLCAKFPAGLWEEYALGMLPEQDFAALEEHLLICPTCQDLLAEADEYIQVAKAALATPQDSFDRPLSSNFRTRRRLSKPVKAAAAFAGSLIWLS